jgi:dUTP pyrophosphatase
MFPWRLRESENSSDKNKSSHNHFNFEQKSVEIWVKVLDHAKDLPLPSYATEQSAGMDLMAATADTITLAPLQRAMIPTGICMALPKGYEAQVRPRSGLAAKNGITVLNTPGTIDADYRGEIKVILVNLSDTAFQIERGMRIAQMVIAPYAVAQMNAVQELDETARGSGGFGSTGVKD